MIGSTYSKDAEQNGVLLRHPFPSLLHMQYARKERQRSAFVLPMFWHLIAF
jgi:hypothetical protein